MKNIHKCTVFLMLAFFSISGMADRKISLQTNGYR